MEKIKKGSLNSIVIFFAVTIAIIMIAPFLLKLINAILGNMSTSLIAQNSSSFIMAGNATTYIQAKTNTMWDGAMVFLFVGNILVLIVSAFLVTVSPAFIIIFIVGCVFLFITAPALIDATQSVWGAGSLSTETTAMPMLNFILNNLIIILLVLVFIVGIIAYAKFKRGNPI